MFIKTTFKDLGKFIRIRKYVLKRNVGISVFLDITKVADFQSTNADVNRYQGVCHVIYVFFLNVL